MYEKRKSDKHGIRDKEREEDKDKMETDPSLRSCKGRGIDRSHGHDKGLSISASFSIIFTGILIVWAVFGASALIADSEEASAVNFQDGSDFYDNFELSYTPEAPNPDEGVWVTLESKTQDNITQAHLYFQYREEGEEDFSEAGGNLMEEGENETVRNGLISDEYHAPGTEVRFWVNATYDEIDWYRSDNYTYTVSDEGGWISEDFDDNLVVDFTPKEPRPDERVNITLVKTHEAEENDVQMNSAVLSATIDQPERSPQEASAVFERENETWRTSIPGYPQNTSVTFYVEATDIHGEQLISDELGYTVMKEVQSVQPLVIVYDPLNERYVDGAVVRVENSSGVVFEGTTEDGQLTVGEPLQPGTYTLTIDYADKTETRELQLTGEETEEDVTFRFEMEDRGSLEHELISFPQWSSVAGLIAAIFLPLLLLGWTYKKKEEKKIDLAEGDKGESRQNGNVWVEKIVKKVIEETRDPEYLIPAGFFLLSVCGLVFIPFYPFWMILLLSVVVGAVAYKYPLNALLILAVLVTGSAAYQTPEFGLVFLVFSLLVMLASFFDWRFGFLVFSMVFLARFGALYFVPVMSVFLFSSFLAIISTAAAGTFLVMLSSSGNWELMGFVTSAPHHSSFMRFDRPVVSNFSPSSLGSALNSVGSANPNIIQTILSNNFGASVLPFIQILLWTVAIYLLSRITEARGPKFDRLKEWLRYPLRKEWRISLASALLLGASPLIGLLYFGYIFDMGLVGIALSVGILVGGVALAYVAQGLGYMTKSMFREYYRSKLGISDVGTRIAEMADLGETPFENVGGLEDVKQDVKESILLPLLRPDISKKFGVETSKGLLLYGPPGCGKTLLMKALATELDIEMINVK
ncbi:MAG: AAA family ATPase, partial [Candidatus Natronoplasma sp.]